MNALIIKPREKNFDRYINRPMKLFKFLGITFEKDKPHNKILKGFIPLGSILILIQLICSLLLCDKNFSEISEIVSDMNYFFVGSFKMLFLIYNRSSLGNCYIQLKAIYPYEEIEKKYHLSTFLKIYLKVEKLLWIFFKYVFSLFIIYPFILSCYGLWRYGHFLYITPFKMWYPMDIHETYLGYTFYYLFETIMGLFISISLLNPDLCLLGCILQFCMHYDVLCKKISEINPEDPESVFQLKNIIKEHQIVLRLVKKIDRIFTPSVLLSLTSSSFILCFTTYRLLNEKSLFIVFTVILLLGFEMKQVIIICYFGNLLMDTSSKMFDALCKQNWLRSSLEYKKMFLLMLMVTRRPVVLNISGIAEVNLVTLKQVLSFSFQVFAVLKNT